MDPTGPIAQRFPLIARPRPACTALSARVDALAALADSAARDGDIAAASRVQNQAALIASDCAQPELARAWCHRHAAAYLRHRRHDARTARLALEPLVNLARLHIRAGDGESGYLLINTLFEAIRTGTDIVIDGIDVPAEALHAADHDQKLRQWLYTVHLADGTRALTSAGRWHDAQRHLRARNGISRGMLDGRQVAVIAAIVAGEIDSALTLIAEAKPSQPWEAVVGSCLTLLCTEDPDRKARPSLTTISLYRRLSLDALQVVFSTRLGLSIIDALSNAGPHVIGLLEPLFDNVRSAHDGYAARDLLTHSGCSAALTSAQHHQLACIVAASGLGRALPQLLHERLEVAITTCETVIERELLSAAA